MKAHQLFMTHYRQLKKGKTRQKYPNDAFDLRLERVSYAEVLNWMLNRDTRPMVDGEHQLVSASRAGRSVTIEATNWFEADMVDRVFKEAGYIIDDTQESGYAKHGDLILLRDKLVLPASGGILMRGFTNSVKFLDQTIETFCRTTKDLIIDFSTIGDEIAEDNRLVVEARKIKRNYSGTKLYKAWRNAGLDKVVDDLELRKRALAPD